ncbi:MAG: TetR/AcrR family transcriptional regulator [Pseudomonadota bacterium]
MARTSGSQAQTTALRVRAAATRLFASRGYAAVSMRAIAAEVGVHVGALYHYTKDKQALLFDLMREHMEVLLSALPAPDTSDPMMRLHAFVRFHLEFHADRPDEVFIAYMELRNLTPANFAEIEALRRCYEDHLEMILLDGRQAGVFQMRDTKIVTMALIAMLTGVNTWFQSKGRLSLEEVIDEYWELVRKAVGAGDMRCREQDDSPAASARRRD